METRQRRAEVPRTMSKNSFRKLVLWNALEKARFHCTESHVSRLAGGKSTNIDEWGAMMKNFVILVHSRSSDEPNIEAKNNAAVSIPVLPDRQNTH